MKLASLFALLMIAANISDAFAAPSSPAVDWYPFADVAIDSSGQKLLMSRARATAYCASKGMHLPSAREMAQVSVSYLGASNVFDPSADYQGNVVKTTEQDGRSDIFAYDLQGYNAGLLTCFKNSDPNCRKPFYLVDDVLWTTSISRDTSPNLPLVFIGRYGGFDYAGYGVSPTEQAYAACLGGQ